MRSETGYVAAAAEPWLGAASMHRRSPEVQLFCVFRIEPVSFCAGQLIALLFGGRFYSPFARDLNFRCVVSCGL